jgi:hypothetical protein
MRGTFWVLLRTADNSRKTSRIGGFAMKKFLSVLILCLVPSFVFAGEQEVLNALENIRKQLDAGVEEPVNETLDRLISEAKAAINANEAAGKKNDMFTVEARKSLEYFENIARMTKMGMPPFEADRKQADKFLLEAARIHRDSARSATAP